MAAFAGRLTPSDPSVAASPYGEAGFYALNFDTLGGASVCLLVLLVEHDWPVIVSGTTAAIGVGAWVYFLTFWVVCIVMVQVCRTSSYSMVCSARWSCVLPAACDRSILT